MSEVTTRLYLVRHGQSVANVTWEFSYRRVDPPLTDLGREQAQATAAHLRSLQIDAMYCSPMLRAIQTAEIFKAAIGLDFVVIEDLREVNVGDLEDLPSSKEAWDVHFQVHRDWADGRLDSTFPGGEGYHGLSGRALRAFARIVSERPGQAILVVGHGAIFTAAVAALCPDVRMAEIMKLPNSNCGITTVDIQADIRPGGQSGDLTLTGVMDGWARRTHLEHLPQRRFPPPWATPTEG